MNGIERGNLNNKISIPLCMKSYAFKNTQIDVVRELRESIIDCRVDFLFICSFVLSFIHSVIQSSGISWDVRKIW